MESVAQPATLATRPAALRVLILAGAGTHDWQATTAFLRQLLTDSGRFDVRVNETPAGVTASALASFDVVVSDCSGASLTAETERALDAFVSSGKGLVVTRGELAGEPASSTWTQLIKAAEGTNPGAGADGS